MKFALVYSDLGLGGVQRKLIELAREVIKSGRLKESELRFVIDHRTQFSFASSLPTRIQVRYIRKENASFFWLLPFALPVLKIYRVVKELWRFQPDVIWLQFHFYVPAVLLYQAFSGRRVRIVINQDNVLSSVNRRPYFKTIFPRWIIRFCYAQAARIFVQSTAIKVDAVRYLKLPSETVAKFRVTPNWTLAHPSATSPQRGWDIGFYGRFSQQKRLDRCLGVIKLLSRQYTPLRVKLMGDGEGAAWLKAAVRIHSLSSSVSISKPQVEITAQLQSTKILLLTSDFEGHPLVLLEAMAQGVVPVVFAYPGAHEHITDGRDGFIVNSERAAAQRCLFLLKHPHIWRKMSQNARFSVKTQFGQSRLNQVITEMFDE